MTYKSDYTQKEILDLLIEVDEKATGLNDWEIKFISDLVDNPPNHFSDKQIKKIQELYDNWC